MRQRINKQILAIRNTRAQIHRVLLAQNSESVSLTQHTFQTNKTRLKDLRIAAIMDRFTLECFRPECTLMELTPDGWRREMEGFQPDLLFIESAWEGKDGLWRTKVNHCSAEIFDLTDYCHERKIPVVFWNKEDPVYTDAFLPTAKRADAVFTTDIECIEKYKTELEHDRVYHLHFAAQPVIHNPIEKYERKDRFCFAGAYYHRYQDRCRVFDAFSDYFIESRGFDIYDRNFMNARPEYKFPEQYDPYILGKLDPSEIDIAYKGYVYGVNMNSVTQSQTMFARRVFELMASNTLVVGNYSRGVKNYFGDLTFCTDDEKTLRASLERYCADADSTDKLRLLALRKVLSEHLMEDRLDYIVQKVFGKSIKAPLPAIAIYSHVSNQKEADHIVAMHLAQSYRAKKLLLVSDADLCVPDGVQIMKCADFQAADASSLISNEDYLACFSAEDWYGASYLLDLALATRYGKFDAIGKADYFTAVDGAPVRVRNMLAYHQVSELTDRRCMVNASLLNNLTGADLAPNHLWNGAGFMSVDAMNYCEVWPEYDCLPAKDLDLADQGISLSTIEKNAQKIKMLEPNFNTTKVDISAIAKIRIGKDDPVQLQRQGDYLLLTSNLPQGEKRFYYLDNKFDIDLYADNGKLDVWFRGEAKMNLTGVCTFFDVNNKKLDTRSFKIGTIGQATLPAEAAYMKVAFRVCGPGSATLQAAEFGVGVVSSLRGGTFLSRSNVLVLTNHYPAPDNLYRNMFVHKRLTAYKNRGKTVDLMRMNPYADNILREFEGINVIEGHGDMLDSILKGASIDTVCVHFLDKDMWNILERYSHTVRVLIWLHGAEIQPWWRREYNYKTEEELSDAKVKSEERMAFWQEVFSAAKTNTNIHFIFVSQYFADEIFTDYAISLSKEQYSIIHNCIDTEQFNYIPKQKDDRKKLLSIRPYASNKYANDLTVKAILELAKGPWFDELDIALYGSGPMFEEILAPLQNLKNVHTEKTFLTQNEIAALHKQYGVFLTPTRMDAQGVSRDEAMSSGLVPVTNAVTAIPEFVSENCGILAEGEDYIGMAEGIKRLYHDPELFLQMSENAAKRVRSQTSREYTIDKELQLIFPSPK